MTVRPVIGISTYREQASWGVWSQRADLLHSEYADTLVAAGGAPVLLPPASGDPDVAAALVARLDGLVIAGGADVEPARYGEEPHPTVTSWRVDRDRWELLLLDAADRVGLPVLGICRGMQLLAVHAGGSLEQHTPDRVGHDEHSPGRDAFGTTTIATEPGSRLARLIGEQVEVACHHHQAVRAHPGFRRTATAADGTVEAMEADGDRFLLGVQWHPEMRTELPLFVGLVAAATAFSPTVEA